jgi:small-conductance mechanosensitive channel
VKEAQARALADVEAAVASLRQELQETQERAAADVAQLEHQLEEAREKVAQVERAPERKNHT